MVEGKFRQLRNRVLSIIEFQAAHKVLDNLPSRKGEVDWLKRITAEENKRRLRDLKVRVGGLVGLVEPEVREFVRINFGRDPKSVTWDATVGTWVIGCHDEEYQTQLKLRNGKLLSSVTNW